MEVVISGASSPQVQIVESGNTVVVTRPIISTVSLTMAGPQGPAFTGQQLFNIGAIEQLTVANSGSTLQWNGTQYVPASELGTNLTINGGAF
jgi:hypothetical protein